MPSDSAVQSETKEGMSVILAGELLSSFRHLTDSIQLAEWGYSNVILLLLLIPLVHMLSAMAVTFARRRIKPPTDSYQDADQLGSVNACIALLQVLR